MATQTYDRSVTKAFKPFTLGRDETFRRLDEKAQESNRRMVRLAKEKLKLTPMIDPEDGSTKLVHEDCRFLNGYIGYDFIQLSLGGDTENGFSRDSFASMAQYLKAVGKRFDDLTAKKSSSPLSAESKKHEADGYISYAEAAEIMQVSERFLKSMISFYSIYVHKVEGLELLSRADVMKIGAPTNEVLEAEIKTFLRSAPKRFS